MLEKLAVNERIPPADIELTEEDVLSVASIEFTENTEINEGMCSCVCINDEQCCGCLLQ